ncbi:MAG: dipeptidase [Clostridia bacterium]|nr:dipeptidase [Clostridia bacterium]
MKIIDLHCDTLMECYLSGRKLRESIGHIDLMKMKEGGALAQMFAIFIPTNDSAKRHGATQAPYDYFNSVVDLYNKEMAANADLIAPAHCVADILANKAAGKMSGVLTVEDGVALDGKIERIDEFYQKGVRMIGLTWNYENCIGYPCKDDPKEHMLGLKPFGIEAIKRMNELGIMIDTSHLSEGGFWDVIKHSSKPFMASHSCARALRDHRRNLTDEQLRALAEKGGICGVNFYSAFLHTDGDLTRVDDIVRHMVYIANKAGIETVAMGSDFDGIDNPQELKNYAGMPLLVDALGKHFSDDQIDKICSGNALRIMQDCIG